MTPGLKSPTGLTCFLLDSGYYNLMYRHPLQGEMLDVMGGNRPSKEWSPFSKEIKLDEKDWAVVEGLFQNHRNTVGVVSKADFVKELMLAGASSQLVQLRKSDPAALTRIAKAGQSYSRTN